MSLEGFSTDCLADARGRCAHLQDEHFPSSLLQAINSHDSSSAAPSLGECILRKVLQILLNFGGKQWQNNLIPMFDAACLSRFLCVVFRGLVLSQVTLTLCVIRGAGTQCLLLFGASQVINLSFKKKKAEIVKVSKHRNHNSGQILKMLNGTMKVLFQKKCSDALKHLSSWVLDNAQVKKISILLSYTSSIFQRCLVGVPMKKSI